MAKKKKYNTGKDITICNNFVGDVITANKHILNSSNN